MMSESEPSRRSEAEIVAVTKHGQATIPKRFRDKLGIDAPGKVKFRETEDEKIVVEHVRSPEAMRGFAKARGEANTETPATELLREKRTHEKEERETRFSADE